jgi:hypothetical protein
MRGVARRRIAKAIRENRGFGMVVPIAVSQRDAHGVARQIDAHTGRTQARIARVR